MNSEQFRTWMEKNRKSVADVASATDLGTSTVYRARADWESMHESSQRLLMEYVQRVEDQKGAT